MIAYADKGQVTLGDTTMVETAEPLSPAPQDLGKGAHRLTERQIQAVYTVMRLLRRDRPAAGDDATIECQRCQRPRPARGSIAYGAILLCNGCATDYELLRTAGSVRFPEEFLRRR
jgi:hypothetical protein